MISAKMIKDTERGNIYVDEKRIKGAGKAAGQN